MGPPSEVRQVMEAHAVAEAFVLEQVESWRRLVSLDNLDDLRNRIPNLPAVD